MQNIEKNEGKEAPKRPAGAPDLLLVTIGSVSASMELLFLTPEGEETRHQTVYNSQKLGSRWHVNTSGSEQRIPVEEYPPHLKTAIETEILGRSSLPTILSGHPARVAHVRGTLGEEVKKSLEAGKTYDLYEIGIGARSAFAFAS